MVPALAWGLIVAGGARMNQRGRPCAVCESGENTTGLPGTLYGPEGGDVIIVRCPACQRFPTDRAAQHAYEYYEQLYGCSFGPPE